MHTCAYVVGCMCAYVPRIRTRYSPSDSSRVSVDVSHCHVVCNKCVVEWVPACIPVSLPGFLCVHLCLIAGCSTHIVLMSHAANMAGRKLTGSKDHGVCDHCCVSSTEILVIFLTMGSHLCGFFP